MSFEKLISVAVIAIALMYGVYGIGRVVMIGIEYLSEKGI